MQGSPDTESGSLESRGRRRRRSKFESTSPLTRPARMGYYRMTVSAGTIRKERCKYQRIDEG